MSQPSKDRIKKIVRKRYGNIAKGHEQSCCGEGASCAGKSDTRTSACRSEVLGYSASELDNLPHGADLGLGCGNPQAIAALKPGETVLDLGSGAGIDCFLAARQVGTAGHVIGVDMTHEMLEKARENARKGGFKNTEFRLGEIEHLPVADGIADVIISNCVINLSPDKSKVWSEMFRALKSGGRVAISDIVATAELPENVRRDLSLHAGCVAGASLIKDVKKMLKEAGFEDIRITPKGNGKDFIRKWISGSRVENYIVSANIEARKPVK